MNDEAIKSVPRSSTLPASLFKKLVKEDAQTPLVMAHRRP